MRCVDPRLRASETLKRRRRGGEGKMKTDWQKRRRK
jgi:hypothetical protein